MPHLVKRKNKQAPAQITCGTMYALIKENEFKDVDFAFVEVRGETKKHYHKRLTEFYFVVDGSLEVEIDGAKEKLMKGDIIQIMPNTDHKAYGNADLLVVCCPPWREEDEIVVE